MSRQLWVGHNVCLEEFSNCILGLFLNFRKNNNNKPKLIFKNDLDDLEGLKKFEFIFRQRASSFKKKDAHASVSIINKISILNSKIIRKIFKLKSQKL